MSTILDALRRLQTDREDGGLPARERRSSLSESIGLPKRGRGILRRGSMRWLSVMGALCAGVALVVWTYFPGALFPGAQTGTERLAQAGDSQPVQSGQANPGGAPQFDPGPPSAGGSDSEVAGTLQSQADETEDRTAASGGLPPIEQRSMEEGSGQPLQQVPQIRAEPEPDPAAANPGIAPGPERPRSRMQTEQEVQVPRSRPARLRQRMEARQRRSSAQEGRPTRAPAAATPLRAADAVVSAASSSFSAIAERRPQAADAQVAKSAMQPGPTPEQPSGRAARPAAPRPPAKATAVRTERQGPPAAVRRPLPEPAPRPEIPPESPIDDPIGFPALAVNMVRWHPDPKRREATIEVDGSAAVAAREGDLVGGALLARIGPGEVEFRVGMRSKVVRVGQ